MICSSLVADLFLILAFSSQKIQTGGSSVKMQSEEVQFVHFNDVVSSAGFIWYASYHQSGADLTD
jgi:hypothetical protein